MTRQSRQDFEADVKNGKKIVFYGSNTLLMRFINMFCLNIMESVKYIVDYEPDKQGKRIYGINILSHEKLISEKADDVIIVITSAHHNKEILEIVNMINQDFKVYIAKILVNDVLEHAAVDLYDHQTETTKVCELLYDSVSKKIYT